MDAKANLRRETELNLKRVYQEALSQEVPDRFKVLLEQLRAKDAAKSAGAASK